MLSDDKTSTRCKVSSRSASGSVDGLSLDRLLRPNHLLTALTVDWPDRQSRDLGTGAISVVLQAAAPSILLDSSILVPLAGCLVFLSSLLIHNFLRLLRDRLGQKGNCRLAKNNQIKMAANVDNDQ